MPKNADGSLDLNKNISYYSTNLQAPEVTFREALLQGLAPDRGLYLPVSIPKIPPDELESFSSKQYDEIAFEVLHGLIGGEIDEYTLLNICHDAYNYDIPLEKVYGRNYVMRLDQGPTASFKDFAARMMGRLMQYYLTLEHHQLVILIATSGDTGSAVANAFYGLENIKVLILYPINEVTEMQRQQMTTLKNNIRVIAVDGKFDDCQQMVKKAFSDSLLSNIPLSSANSINIGRLIPQSIYYFYAWSRLSGKADELVIFSVPSGNFGNLMGGLIAREMGLRVKRFVISTNENDEVPLFLKTGKYKTIYPSINCISSAMNVGHPSNLARIFALYGGSMDEAGNIIRMPDLASMQKDFYAVSINDQVTKETIATCYQQYKLLLEPHGAIAWKGLQQYFIENPEDRQDNQLCISLETAHPAKFPTEIMQILNLSPPLPNSLRGINTRPEEYIVLDNNFDKLRDFILKNYESQ